MTTHRKQKSKRYIRQLLTRVWVSWQESSAIMYGVPVQVAGDTFKDGHTSPSPLVTEVYEHVEIHASGRVF